jgi:hypothetical protein
MKGNFSVILPINPLINTKHDKRFNSTLGPSQQRIGVLRIYYIYTYILHISIYLQYTAIYIIYGHFSGSFRCQ